MALSQTCRLSRGRASWARNRLGRVRTARQRFRHLRLEPLESRWLLSINPLPQDDPTVSFFGAEGAEQLLTTPFLEQIEYGLKGGFFASLQERLNAAYLAEPVPLIGTQLASRAAGRIGPQIRAALEDFTVSGSDSAEDVVAALEQQWQELIAEGTRITVVTTSAPAAAVFTAMLSGTLTETVDLDLALGHNSYVEPLLGNQDAVEAEVQWSFALTFGVIEDEGFFIDTSAESELTIGVDAQLHSDYAGIGRLGVFSARMEASTQDDSFFGGTYTVDLVAPGEGVRLRPADFPALELTAVLAGAGEVHFAVDAAFIPDLDTWSGHTVPGLEPSEWDFNLAVTTDLAITYEYGPGEPEGGTIGIEFAHVQLDTNEYLGGFFAPIITALRPILAPLQPMFEILTSPVPGISQLSEAVSGQQVTWLDLGRLAGVSGYTISGVLHTLSLVSTLVNASVPEREPAATAPPNIDLGSYHALYHKRTHEIRTSKITEPGAPVEEKMKQHNDLYASIGGDLSFPLLEDPKNVFDLMRGTIDVPMFSLGVDLNLTFFWTTEWPTPIPGLEVRLEPAVGMVIDLDFGYDTLGVRMLSDALDFSTWDTLSDSLEANAGLLKEGYFLDDHLAPGGQDGDITSQALTVGGVFLEGAPKDGPELKFFAELSVGAKFGTPDVLPVEVSVGVKIPLRLDIIFDLNDLPNRLLEASQREIGFNGAPRGTEYVEEGFRLTTSNPAGFSMATPGLLAPLAGNDQFELTSTREGEVFHLRSLLVDGSAGTTLTFRGTRSLGGRVEETFELTGGPQTLNFPAGFSDLTSVSWMPLASKIDAAIAQWPAGTYPPDPAAFQYDGRVHLSEFQTIVGADPLALFNAGGELSAALELYMRIYLGYEPFTISVFDKTWRMISLTLFDFDLYRHLSDEEILAGLLRGQPQIGGVQGGTLELYMGPSAWKRENTAGSDSNGEIDEEFSIRSLGPSDPNNPAWGETLEVTYLNTFTQTFECVQEITADGGSGDDVIRVGPSVGIPVHLRGGAGHDRLIYGGTGQAILEGNGGNDILIGGSGNDILIGGDDVQLAAEPDSDFVNLRGDLLEGGGGDDLLVGDNATYADGILQLGPDSSGPGDDILHGGTGSDQLFGQGGRDILEGGSGDDWLEGGAGGDRYVWDVGSGNDKFVEQPDAGGEYDQVAIGGRVEFVGSGTDAGNYAFVDRDDHITLSNDNGRLRVVTDVETLSLEGIEFVGVAAGGGADTVTIHALGGTAVGRVAIDLSQPKEAALGTGGRDTVLFEGSDSRADAIEVRGAVQAVPATIVASNTFEERDKAVVQIIDSGSSEPIDYFLMNGDPARDRLVIRGRGGNDSLTLSAGTEGVSVQDLITTTLDGGDGDDVLRTVYGNVEVRGGTGRDMLIIDDDRHRAGKPEVFLSESAVVVVHDMGVRRLVSHLPYADIQELQLNLGSDGSGNAVHVLGTIPGPVAIHGGPDPDHVRVVAVQGPLTVSLGGVDDNDVLTIDRSAEVSGRTGVVSPSQVAGLGLPTPIAYSGVEHLSLVLGSGADRLTVADTGARTTVWAGDGDDWIVLQAMTHPATVYGGNGSDTVVAEIGDLDALSGSPFAGLTLSTETLRVEHAHPQPADWHVEDGMVWVSRIGGEPLTIVDLLGAEQVFFAGNGGGDTLTVADNVPVAQTVTIDRSTVRIQRGAEVLSHQAQDFLPDAAGASAPVITADGQYLYAIGSPDSSVNVYRRDPESGDLSLVRTWREQGKLTAADPGGNDDFSRSVAMDGNTVIVGSPMDDYVGSAYVYEWRGDWVETKLTAADGQPGSFLQFGGSVAISGDTAFIGARNDDDKGLLAGAVYVFQRDAAGNWIQKSKLRASDGAAYGRFGGSVAIAGDRAVVGASGAAYIFERNTAGVWVQKSKLIASGGEPYDWFGSSVAISGDVALVGASGAGNSAGAVYVFQRNAAGGWEQSGRLTAADAAPYSNFGESLAISGDRALVGAPGSQTRSGAAYVFERQVESGAWTQQQKLTGPGGGKAYDGFGRSVSISAGAVVIGASLDDEPAFRGSAHVFERAPDLGQWVGKAKLTGSTSVPGDEFGSAVAISGGRVIVGAPSVFPAAAGSAFVFENLVAAGATAIAISPDGNNVYAARGGSATLSVFRRDGGDGGLALVQNIWDSARLANADALEISPDGSMIFVATDAGVAVFARDPQSGSLSFVQNIRARLADGDAGIQSGLYYADSAFQVRPWFPTAGDVTSNLSDTSHFVGPPDDNYFDLRDVYWVAFDLGDYQVYDRPGGDFNVYEVDFGDVEFGDERVEVSEDGVSWINITGTRGPALVIPGDEAHGSISFARSYDVSGSGLESVRHIRVVGIDDDWTCYPIIGCSGNRGFDFDAIGAFVIPVPDYTEGDDIWRDVAGGTPGVYDAGIDELVFDGGDGYQIVPGAAGAQRGLYYFDQDRSGSYSAGEEIWKEIGGTGAVYDAGTDALVYQPAPGIGRPAAMALSPDGQFLYIATAAEVAIFRMDAGVYLPGGSVPVGGASELAPSPVVGNLYAARPSHNAITAWDPATGALTAVRNGVGGARGLLGVSSLAVAGEYVFAVSSEEDSLSVFARAADGGLTFVQRLRNYAGGVQGLEHPNSAAVSPDGRWLYVTSSGQGSTRPGGLAWFAIGQDAPPPAPPLIVGYSGIGALTVRSADGEDLVSVRNIAVPLTLQTGGGPDTVNIGMQEAGYDVRIDTGAGEDTVAISLSAPGALWLATGPDADEVIVSRVGPAAELDIHTGGGDDAVQIAGYRIEARVTLDGGDGQDTLRFDAGGFPISPPQPTTPTGSIQVLDHSPVRYVSIEAVPGFAAARVDSRGPYSIAEGDPLILIGSASPATGTRIMRFEWDLNADGVFGEVSGAVSAAVDQAVEFTAVVPWPELSLLGPGNGTPGGTAYTITLRALDDAGNFAQADATLTVYDVPPEVRIAGQSEVTEGSVYQLQLFSSDPGADAILGWEICWNWVEGEDNWFEHVPGNPSAVGYRYDAPGLQQIRARAFDADGSYPAVVTEGVDGLRVEVLDALPLLQVVGNDSVEEGGLYELFVQANDPTGDESIGWIIDWGDGSPRESVDVPAATLVHTYADDGNFTIRALAIGADAIYSTAKDVTVNNVVPELRIAGLAAVDESAWYTLFLAARDPGDDEITHWTIDWGDGAVQTVPGGARSVTHRYADDSAGELLGVFRITATAYDEDTDSEHPYRVSRATVLPRPLLAFDTGAGATGHIYTLTGALDWAEAYDAALGLGGHLVDIADYDEQDFLDTSLFGAEMPPDQLWIGLADLDGDGVLKWVTDAEVTYTRWGDGGSAGQPHAALVRQAAGGPARMAFEGLLAGSASYVEDGLRLEAATAGGAPSQFVRADAATGAAAAALCGDDVFTLADVESRPFRLMALDVASEAPRTLTFTGTRIDGATVVQSFQVQDTCGGLQRLIFSGEFVDLVFVSWVPGSTATDNIAVARPLSLWAGRSGTELLAGIVEMESILGLPSVAADGLAVTVRNVAPTLELAGSQTVQEGRWYSLTLGRPFDPGPDTVGEYVVDWGDGTPPQSVSWQTVSVSVAAQRVYHIYADDGDYDVTLVIVDEDGAHPLPAASCLRISVDNAAPVVNAGIDQRVSAGVPVSLAASFSDAGSADTHIATIDWGEGTAVEAGALDQAAGTVSSSHVYLASGIYIVTVTVADDDGGEGTDTFTVTVAGADQEPPVVTVDQLVTRVTTPVITGTVSDGALTVAVGGWTYAAGDGSLTVDGTTWRLQIPPGRALAEGHHEVQASATDAAGNVGRDATVEEVLIDITRPTSGVEPLPERATSKVFTVRATGYDPDGGGAAGAGVAEYRLYVSTNQSAFAYWTTVPADDPAAVFTAQSDSTYGFRSLAVDRAGNLEVEPIASDAWTRVPDLDAPESRVDGVSVDSSAALFRLTLSGTDAGGSGLLRWQLWVQIDGGEPVKAADVAASCGSGGVYHGAASYLGIPDRAAHTYRFFTIGIDQAGNVETAASPPGDVTETAAFAAISTFAVTGLDVQKGAIQRSYLRYLDVAFNQAAGVQGIVDSLNDGDPANDRIRLQQYDLSGQTLLRAKTGLSARAVDRVLEIDFGAGGIGGNPAALDGNGYWRLSVDIDGDLSNGYETDLFFYRLAGDVNGDRKNDSLDLLALNAVLNKTPWDVNGDASIDARDLLDADVDGDGQVTSADRLLVMRGRNKALLPHLPLDG